MEVLLPRGDGYQRETVAYSKQSSDDELIDCCNANPILDTRVYKAVFSGGEGIVVSANIVADSILNSCDADGN